MLAGGFLEVIVALACIGTAVTLYPVVKRQNEGVALGFVTARILEAVMIFAGVVSLLSLVTLRPLAYKTSPSDRRHHVPGPTKGPPAAVCAGRRPRPDLVAGAFGHL